MNSQPPEDADLPEVPPEPDANAPTGGGEFVAPLQADSNNATNEVPSAGYDTPVPVPPKRYDSGTVWVWLIISAISLNLSVPVLIAATSSLQSQLGPAGGALMVLPAGVMILAGVGLYRTRDDLFPKRRSRWMGLLIGSGLSLTCAGVCFGALSGI
jgi:hypothetical protein